MPESAHCSVPGCNRLAAALLEGRSHCPTHFISASYEQLDAFSQRLKHQKSYDLTTELVRQLLIECTRQAADLASQAKDLDNLERARVLDIALSAAELSRHLRRSLRVRAHFPIKLRSLEVGRDWEEDTRTVVVSRCGALVECQHSVAIGETLLMERTDKPWKALARITSSQRGPSGRQEIGIEFLNSKNFWDVDWSTGELAVEQTSEFR